jgi:hypothetical protein
MHAGLTGIGIHRTLMHAGHVQIIKSHHRDGGLCFFLVAIIAHRSTAHMASLLTEKKKASTAWNSEEEHLH